MIQVSVHVQREILETGHLESRGNVINVFYNEKSLSSNELNSQVK